MSLDKFKVGDKVVFAGDLAHQRDPRFYPPAGTRGEIDRVDGDGFPGVRWLDPVPSTTFRFPSQDYLKPLNETQKVLIMQDKADPMKVVARDLSSNKTGEARCNPEDAFDFSIGALIALGRLFGHEPEITSVKAEIKMPLAPCKFKVGDKIIGNAKANRYGITKEGWLGEVIEILDPPIEGYGCDEGSKRTFKARPVNGYGGPWPLDEDAFDLYEEPEEETVIHCNLEETARIIAMIMDFDAEGKVFDWYEQHIQQILSRSEAPSEKLEGKLVCIHSDVYWWTEGKVYEAVNGVLRDNDGEATASFSTLEDCNSVSVHRQFAFLKE